MKAREGAHDLAIVPLPSAPQPPYLYDGMPQTSVPCLLPGSVPGNWGETRECARWRTFAPRSCRFSEGQWVGKDRPQPCEQINKLEGGSYE